jgi:hypothetical protein
MNNMNAGQAIEQTKRIFNFALTNPADEEIDANILDAISDLFDATLRSHLHVEGSNFQLTPAQERKLLIAWRFEEQSK